MCVCACEREIKGQREREKVLEGLCRYWCTLFSIMEAFMVVVITPEAGPAGLKGIFLLYCSSGIT